MSVRIVCPKCSAVINWNGSDTVTACRLCGTKYKMHPKSQANNRAAKEMFMPPVGRGQADILTIPSNREVMGRPVLKTYIPKNWKYVSGTSPDRYDAVSNPIVPTVMYASPDGEISVLYKGEAFYKHIDMSPATMQLQNKMDDILINRRNPTFLRMRSYMTCAEYCDTMAKTLPLNNLCAVKEEHADNAEKQRQRQILENFHRKGFTDGNAEWLRRTYKGVDNSGRNVIVVAETRIVSLIKNTVMQMPQYGGFFGMGMMPGMMQQTTERYWDSQYEMLLAVPENRYSEGLREFERINESIRILPEMNQVRADILAVVNNSLNNIAMDNMNSMNRRSQIIADTNAYTSNIQHQMIADNAASHNRVANLQSEAIRGVNTYYTNDNRVVEASTSFDHVYQNTQNPDIFAAQQGNSLEFGVDFEELTQTNGDYR